ITHHGATPLHTTPAIDLFPIQTALADKPVANPTCPPLSLRRQRLLQLRMRNPALRQHQQTQRYHVTMRNCHYRLSIAKLTSHRRAHHGQYAASTATPLAFKDGPPPASPGSRPSTRTLRVAAQSPLRRWINGCKRPNATHVHTAVGWPVDIVS